MTPNSPMSHPEDQGTRPERVRPASRLPQSESMMNLEDPLLRPVSTPLSTYVAVARGTVAPGDQPRESRGSHRDRSPPKRDLRSKSFSRDATGKEQPRAGTPAPVSSRDARLNTTAVHLRLAPRCAWHHVHVHPGWRWSRLLTPEGSK